MPFVHTEFKDIQIHTAKCDVCNLHNTSIMKQCTICAQNFCTSCWLRRGSDGTHMLNSGDKGYTATEAQARAKATRPRPSSLLKPKKEKASVMKTPSPRLGGRNKRSRRRTVVIEESESEEGDLKNDQMGSDNDDDDDGYGDVALEAPRKMSAVRRGKQRRAPRIEEEHVYNEHEKAPVSRGHGISRAVYPQIDTILQEADAANSLLVLAAGSHGNQSDNITLNNTGNTHNTQPRTSLTSSSNGFGPETLYSPSSFNLINSQKPANQPSMDSAMQPDAWYNVSANGTDPPVSMQVHPYPVNPEVTSKIIGHDSQGNYPAQALLHNNLARSEHSISTDRDLISPPANLVQEDAQEKSLFIDPASDEEITAMSALMPEDPAWSTAPSSAMSDHAWQAWLSKEFPKELCKAMSKVEPGMDARGERLFGNESAGEVWNSEIFNENYFDDAHDEVEEGRAVAKANLDTGSGTRASRVQAAGPDEEGSEEGEIMEDDDMGSG